jgi:hypothetical protein
VEAQEKQNEKVMKVRRGSGWKGKEKGIGMKKDKK